MRAVSLFTFVFLIIALLACGSKAPQPGTPESTLANIPEWYADPPKDNNYLFATNTSTSRDMQLAIDRARQLARTDLASQMESKIQSLTGAFIAELEPTKESDIKSQLNDAGLSAISTVMNSAKIKNQEIVVDNGIYRAYVLMEMPLGAANEALMQQIKNNAKLQARLSSTAAYEDLAVKVESYRQFKKEQGIIR